ncbi:WYL domain-containing protein [Delftia sp. GW456-R20]|uniref:WYL domain-containing protein n=1 Tax=Delftia sp. GW456-R20 TaxID=1827145 RepID=UPI0007AE42CF|nr:WYL domain-containing protein [Delftia sp. GW456-R20]
MVTHPSNQTKAVIDRRSDVQDERLKRVARLLIWEGRLSRARLIELFGLSGTRASEWLKEFREMRPEWVEWDSRLRSLVTTRAAYRAIEKSEAAAVELMDGAEPDIGVQDGDSALILPWDFSRVSPYVFSRLRLAVKDGVRIGFNYSSMSRPSVHARVIEPHSIIRAGRRWHVRGYCVERRDFRDFALGRISDVLLTEEASCHRSTEDAKWNRSVKVRLVAHPALSAEQMQLVRREYFAGTAARSTTCRGPLVPYFIQELRAATDVERQLPPDYQLALDNREECKEWLFPT